jgi:ribosomal protein S18 acetylase RimI-like enzyme
MRSRGSSTRCTSTRSCTTTCRTATPEQRVADIRFCWRGDATDRDVVALVGSEAGWWDRVRPHSLGWVVARDGGSALVGFVNVAWDGGDHAFLLDTAVRPDHRRSGIGTELVRIAARHAADAGCEWLEVDFDEHLTPFYLDACGFRATRAGLIRLRSDGGR